ncbi:MAG TPA: Ig-like domain repeat protein [Candidatus Eisenbacteria bacterium]|nr:Ig-like domain repeat protein [Candidatus Eisenbacteria bacterium]
MTAAARSPLLRHSPLAPLLFLLLAGAAHAATSPPARPAPGFASLLAPDVARRFAHDMSPMGARAAGFGGFADPDRVATLAPLRLGPTGIEVIGGADIDVNGSSAAGTQSETSIAANATGSILIVGFNDSRGFPDPTNPDQSTLSLSGLARSADGGASWQAVPVGPGGASTLPTVTHGSVYGDPDVKYDPTRDQFFYSSIYVRPSDGLQGICIAASNSGVNAGTSWSSPIQVTPSFVTGNAADKPFIDVNTVTGRIMVTWTNFSSTSSSIRRAFSDDGGTTWSTVTAIATGSVTTGLQASVPRFLPGATNAASTVYVAWSVSTSTTRNIGMSRSTDGGATWSPPVNIDATSFPVEDQILGVDRVNSSPSLAVDRSTGQVYVVYQRNSSQGTGDIALRTFAGAPAAGTAVLIGSNPLNDRPQFLSWVTVDQGTGRVHALWYDQDHDASGDVTELMHTYSDNHGASWSRPTPLFDRPFHAGYGNDTSQPNLGDYLEAVALNGQLHSAAAATSALSQFNEGLPGLSLFSPDVYYDRLADATQVASLRLVGTQMSELCASGANGALEPGETGAFTFTLENYVGNATAGAVTLSSISGTLTTPSPGVTITQATQSFPTLAPLATGANATAFLVKLDPSFVPGTYVSLVLAVQTDHGAIEIPYLLATGAPGTASTLINENFESATPPALPTGWNSVVGLGTAPPAWVTSSTGPNGAVPGKAAFHTETGSGSNWVRLFSPIVTVPIPGGPNVPYLTLDFDVAYDTEDDPAKLVQAFDGMFVRITDLTGGTAIRSVLAEAIAERFTTGSNNDYPKHFPVSNDANYFEDMAAWAGFSNGYVHVSMKFPGAGFVGRSIQLRFEWTQDGSGDCTAAGHATPCGVAIDNVVLSLVPTTGTFALQSSATTLTTSPNPATQGSPVQLTAHLTPPGAGGTVEFFDGATSLGTAGVSSDTAGISVSGLTVGTHSLTAHYSGDACDDSSTCAPVSQQINSGAGVTDPSIVAFALTEVSPNPVRSGARIGFALPREAAVDLRVLDLQGRVATVIAHGTLPAGRHVVSWNGRAGGSDAGAGMYFVQLRAGGHTFVRRIVVAR